MNQHDNGPAHNLTYDPAHSSPDALRDDLAEARRERNMYRLLYLAALDGLSLVATAPERYEQMQRDLTKERIAFVAERLRADAPPKEQA